MYCEWILGSALFESYTSYMYMALPFRARSLCTPGSLRNCGNFQSSLDLV